MSVDPVTNGRGFGYHACIRDTENCQGRLWRGPEPRARWLHAQPSNPSMAARSIRSDLYVSALFEPDPGSGVPARGRTEVSGRVDVRLPLTIILLCDSGIMGIESTSTLNLGRPFVVISVPDCRDVNGAFGFEFLPPIGHGSAWQTSRVPRSHGPTSRCR
jgi:hypothetical protein